MLRYCSEAFQSSISKSEISKWVCWRSVRKGEAQRCRPGLLIIGFRSTFACWSVHRRVDRTRLAVWNFPNSFATSHPQYTHTLAHITVKMSAEEDQSQSGYEDGLAGGPGAPTPLAGLEVSLHVSAAIQCAMLNRHRA